MSIDSLDKGNSAGPSAAIDSLVERVRDAVSGIRFGSVELVIHEGRVVQIEKRERVRLERQGAAKTEA